MEWSNENRAAFSAAQQMLQGAENKRRLSVEQVRKLEMTFREDSRIEPAKKFRLAKDLGLEPRQVAVWFQNRRVRSRNKQLEKDFQSLQHDYQLLTRSYESLFEEIMKLQSEVQRLSCRSRHEQGMPHESAVSNSEGAGNRLESDSTEVPNDEEMLMKYKQGAKSCVVEKFQEMDESCNNADIQFNNGGLWFGPDYWFPLTY